MYQTNRDITRRSRRLKNGRRGEGPVVYWVSRDQRMQDNWALLWAQQEAVIREKGLVVIFCLVQNYPGATRHHYGFMLHGLLCMKNQLQKHNIQFLVLTGDPSEILPVFLKGIDAHLLVCDFDPLRIKRQWQTQLLDRVVAPIFEVDAHNIIPAWTVSDKKEYAAYTIRPKIKWLLDDYMTDFPPLQTHPCRWSVTSAVETQFAQSIYTFPSEDLYSCQFQPGEVAALAAAENFIKHGLQNYVQARNNPCLDGQSGLSPYLHFGHLSAHRLARFVSLSGEAAETTESFLEELIVRRELADNYCLYEPHYDSFAGFPEWARKSLDIHRQDKREYVYSLQELEESRTHEALWNGCQLDLVQGGKLHGYLRMYWAKKILEWTDSPETALEYAILLNDRYSLDGRDPNGYTGVAWSIGGVHDRAWKERPVFGKIRYMNEAGCRRKFDTALYLRTVSSRKSNILG